MRFPTIGVGLCAAAVLACTPQTGGMSADEEAMAIAAIEQVMVDELAAAMAGDIEGFRAILSDDVIFMPPGAPIASGKDAVLAMMEEFTANTVFENARYTTNNISIHGDVAIHQFTGQWTTATPDGEPLEELSKGIHILERTPDGNWVITMDVWNTDTPPAGAM